MFLFFFIWTVGCKQRIAVFHPSASLAQPEYVKLVWHRLMLADGATITSQQLTPPERYRASFCSPSGQPGEQLSQLQGG